MREVAEESSITPVETTSRVKLGFGAKLTSVMLAAALIPFAVALVVTLNIASNAFWEQITAQLDSLRDSKYKELHAYLSQIEDQVATLSDSEMTIDATKLFTESFFAMPEQLAVTQSELSTFTGSLHDYYRNPFGKRYKMKTGDSVDPVSLMPSTPAGIVAQHQYISANPESIGRKGILLSADDGTSYSEVHRRYHSRYRNYLNQFGYYDIFIVEPQSGHVIYSVFKQLDYGTSLVDGPYKNTNLARVFLNAKNATEPGEVFFADFEHYTPSYGAPAAFIASPIFDGSSLVGVLVFQIPSDRINAVMYQTVGMGETGEIMLVGSDYLMRSQSRLNSENTVLGREVRHAGVAKAFAGEQGTHEADNTRRRGVNCFLFAC